MPTNTNKAHATISNGKQFAFFEFVVYVPESVVGLTNVLPSIFKVNDSLHSPLTDIEIQQNSCQRIS